VFLLCYLLARSISVSIGSSLRGDAVQVLPFVKRRKPAPGACTFSFVKKTRDQYLFQLRQTVDRLKAWLDVPSLTYSNEEQDKLVLQFIDRGLQIGEACFRIADLRTPILVLSRVLCEDFLRMFWILRSKENAAEYAKSLTSDSAKGARVHLKQGRAVLRRKSTGEDMTETLKPEFSKLIVKQKTVEQIAIASGLGKVYDIVHRFDSPEVHGKPLPRRLRADDEEALLAAFPAIIALLEAEILITDNRATTAEEVLRHLRANRIMKHV
jgi:hypothetical protein